MGGRGCGAGGGLVAPSATTWGHRDRTGHWDGVDRGALTPTPTTAGISLKTQELYALVFVCRYLDLFYSFVSL